MNLLDTLEDEEYIFNAREAHQDSSYDLSQTDVYSSANVRTNDHLEARVLRLENMLHRFQNQTTTQSSSTQPETEAQRAERIQRMTQARLQEMFGDTAVLPANEHCKVPSTDGQPDGRSSVVASSESDSDYADPMLVGWNEKLDGAQNVKRQDQVSRQVE